MSIWKFRDSIEVSGILQNCYWIFLVKLELESICWVKILVNITHHCFLCYWGLKVCIVRITYYTTLPHTSYFLVIEYWQMNVYISVLSHPYYHCQCIVFILIIDSFSNLFPAVNHLKRKRKKSQVYEGLLGSMVFVHWTNWKAGQCILANEVCGWRVGYCMILSLFW